MAPRSSTTLAELSIACDERDAARQLLAPVYGWSRKGLTLAICDLKEAKALLDELNA
jgi:hypothetical protein